MTGAGLPTQHCAWSARPTVWFRRGNRTVSRTSVQTRQLSEIASRFPRRPTMPAMAAHSHPVHLSPQLLGALYRHPAMAPRASYPARSLARFVSHFTQRLPFLRLISHILFPLAASFISRILRRLRRFFTGSTGCPMTRAPAMDAPT